MAECPDAVADAVAAVLAPLGLELFDAELIGAGRGRTLRVYIDRDGGSISTRSPLPARRSPRSSTTIRRLPGLSPARTRSKSRARASSARSALLPTFAGRCHPRCR